MIFWILGCLPLSNDILRLPPNERDADLDGVSVLEGDCNDQNPNISPNEPEHPYNGVDDDCSSESNDDDVDKDGFLVADDCDDRWSAVWLGAPEECTDGRDDNCNGISDTDEVECQGLAAGPPTLVWQNFWGGAGNDGLTGVTADAEENVFVVGTSDAPLDFLPIVRPYSVHDDLVVGKLDAQGQPQWASFLGGEGFESNGHLACAQDGGLWVMGTSGMSGWGEPRWPFINQNTPFLARLDQNGQLLWHGFFDSNLGSNQGNYGLITDEKGWVYISMIWRDAFTGFDNIPARRSGYGYYSMVVMALDASGEIQWVTALGPSTDSPNMQQMGSPSSNNMVIDNGRLYVALTTGDERDWGDAPDPVRARTPAEGTWLAVESAVAALDSQTGDLLAYTWLGGSGEDEVRALTFADGSLYVGGESTVSWGRPSQAFIGPQSAWIARLDTDLNLVDLHFYGEGHVDLYTLNWSGTALWAGLITDQVWDETLYGRAGRNFSGERDWAVLRLGTDLEVDWYGFYGSTQAEGDYVGMASQGKDLWLVGASDLNWGSPLRPPDAGFDGVVLQLKDPLFAE